MIRVGVFGAGHLGKIHLKLLNASEYFELVGFYDVNREASQRLAIELGYTYFEQADELMNQIDALFIITPTPFHFDFARAALERNLHVFVEKPICELVDDATQLVQLAAQKKRVAQVGHVERFNPAFVAALPHLNHPKFIEVHRLAEFNPRGTDISVVLDLMIHDIDLVLQCNSSAIKRIDANGAAVISTSVDIATARIEFEDSCVANLTASRISLKNMRKLRCFQKDAYITVDLLEKRTEIVRIKDALENPGDFDLILPTAEGEKKQIYFESPAISLTNAIEEEHTNFAQAIVANSTTLVTFEDGKRALSIAREIVNQLEEKIL